MGRLPIERCVTSADSMRPKTLCLMVGEVSIVSLPHVDTCGVEGLLINFILDWVIDPLPNMLRHSVSQLLDRLD